MEEATWKVPKRGKSHKKAVAEGKVVETANDLATPDFMQRYAPAALQQHVHASQWDTTNSEPTMLWTDGTNIKKQHLESCLSIIEQTSAQDYLNSETGWSRSKKRKEMVLPDMKYILLFNSSHDTNSDQTLVLGFISFMITYEDGHEVVYVYEIHFLPAWQRKGHGRQLMAFVEAIGGSVGVEKAMLTVFRSNKKAVHWYEKLGYAEDEFSPEPRKLRNGTIKEPTYVILSKAIDEAG